MKSVGCQPNIAFGHRAEEWKSDPKHLSFVLARYTFVSKMLNKHDRVLEIGAGDGWASEIVRKSVSELVCTDIKATDGVWGHDILEGPIRGFDAAYALDVYEHVDPSQGWVFLKHMAECVIDRGVVIIGVPSIESQAYATQRAEHINCMTAAELKNAMRDHFHPVFMFGMNDSTLHTGFDQMRHYNFALGVK